MKRLSTYLLIALLSTGCKKYLAEEPRKQASVQTVAQLEALVDNATQFAYEPDFSTILSTDDNEITKELYAASPSAFTTDNLQYYTFSVDGVENASSDALWNGEYKKIFTANLILENIDAVTGDDSTRERVRADAHFIRGYSYWVLVNHYAAPYSAANLESPGVPLKKTTEYTESLKRASLKETYDFIMADIVEAQKVTYDDVDPRRAWRVSKKSIAAFLSRYYLFTGDYDNAIQQANLALATTTAKLVDFSTLQPGTPAYYTNPIDTLRYLDLNSWTPAKFLYWPESFYTRYTYYSSQWYNPSTALMNLYDQQHDLRFKGFFIHNGGRRMSVTYRGTTRYTFFYDGRYIPAGFTVAEVLLNKAEALARKGDINGALGAANTLREKRISPYTALTATSQPAALKAVLEERRRELPFTMRWYDIRRFSVNDDPSDDVTVSRDFYTVSITGVDMNTPHTYTLNNKRLLVPISQKEIDVSKGQITQNTY
ncbi:SusD family protein [Chitinophaga costaii]|uniref:SusD family protein n=1 Tax=Chitinophaga costaii TaxID=1335309 RepID=A0A1C4EXU2_9BACT|nr:RagB/SusD family nutrient uptake outer membrane protein [Chitinophaga costaii]SCC48539.1 SusD family protein [Chitinophaga costaii]